MGDVSSVYVHSLTCETYLVWRYSKGLLLLWWGWIYAQYMCILWHVKLIWCMVFHRSIVNWIDWRCILSICAFCYMWNLFGVTILHTSFVNWSVGGRCILSIYAFCYVWNLFGVMLFHRSIVNWGVGGRCILSICVFCYRWILFGVPVFHAPFVNWSVEVEVSSVCVYSVICETYLV